MDHIGEIKEKGYIVVSACNKISTEEIIKSIGDYYETGSSQKIHILKPRKVEESNPNTYSGIYGCDKFPLHTDLSTWINPPRFLLLRSIVPVRSVYTSVFNPKQLYSEFKINDLKRIVLKPRRPIKNKKQLMQLLTQKDGFYQIRWDSIFLEPASNFSTHAIRDIKKYLNEVNVLKIYLKNPGEILIVDNWKMLHGRSSVPNNDMNRQIERVYLRSLYEA